jgi:hypothetical protein
MGLTAGWSKGRSKRYPYYRCAGRCKLTSVRAELLDAQVIELLNKISPKKECIELFTKFVFEEYQARLKTLKKRQQVADAEIERLTSMRSVLVQKNMLGIYTDEIFLEQNALLEKQLAAAQVAKSNTTLQKYDIQKLTAFICTTLSDLGETYKRSSVSQIQALLGSIFPSGISLNQNGTLNHEINSMYQWIFDFEKACVASGDPMRNRTAVPRMRTWCPDRWTMGPCFFLRFYYQNEDIVYQIFVFDGKAIFDVSFSSSSYEIIYFQANCMRVTVCARIAR